MNRLYIFSVVVVLCICTSAGAQRPVDLGLGIKWCDCNVGAEAPDSFGDFFAWGETAPKETYNWKTYRFCRGESDSLTKYCTNPAYGKVDGKTRLEACDDAASKNMGPGWRTPTASEWQELIDKCSWRWDKDKSGYVVKSRNGNSIFLPAGGFKLESDHHYFNIDGLYWSADLCAECPYSAWRVYFAGNFLLLKFHYRYYGRLVRPVYDPRCK